ncbi:MAG: hypothetical protein NVSMB27_19830 [Ktedonobacteraceae bacterium]
MATQEERLTTVEQKVEALQQKTARAIQEIEENTTIMLGVIRSYGRDIRYIFERLETLNTMEQRLDRIEQRLDRMETKFDEHTTLLTQILARLPNTL